MADCRWSPCSYVCTDSTQLAIQAEESFLKPSPEELDLAFAESCCQDEKLKKRLQSFGIQPKLPFTSASEATSFLKELVHRVQEIRQHFPFTMQANYPDYRIFSSPSGLSQFLTLAHQRDVVLLFRQFFGNPNVSKETSIRLWHWKIKNYIHNDKPWIPVLKYSGAVTKKEDMRLTSIPSMVFRLLCLRELDLSNNHIAAIPETICLSACLSRLVVDGNPIKRVPDSFKQDNPLLSVNIANNPLEDAPRLPDDT